MDHAGRIGHMASTAFILAVLASCSGREGDPASMALRDSAGIRIVEYGPLPSAERGPHLSSEPVFRYGDDPGGYLFRVISNGALGPDGSVVVSDAGNQEVVLISPDGSSHSVLARSGEGPGEVLSVSSLFVLGQDTLLIEDDGNARCSIFANDPETERLIPRGV